MSASPAFASTPNVNSALVPATNDASLTAPSHVSTIFTAGANGSKVEEIRVQGVGTTIAGRLNVFRYNGASYFLVDQYLITAITPSATQLVFQDVTTYGNFELKSGDSLVVSVMESGNESLLSVTAFGGDF